MTTALQFAVLGIGTGAVYALLALGVVIVYRASGIVNFSQSAVAVMAGFLVSDLTTLHGWPLWPTFAAACLLGAAFGVVVYWLTVRPLRNASQLTQIIATLAVFLILQGIASVKWGSTTLLLPPFLPTGALQVGGVTVSYGTLSLLVIAAALTLGFWAASKYTLLGIAIRAVSENRRATAAAGWSPDRIATFAWALGGGVGALGGVLVSPITGIGTQDMTLLLVAAVAAALVGGFSSFPITFVGAIGIGIAHAELTNYVTATGASDSLPFLAVLVLLVVRGRGLPQRGHVVERLSEIGSGRTPWKAAVIGGGGLCVLVATVLSGQADAAIGASAVFAIILLSIVLLTGFSGQLSLAQMALAGIAALIAGRLVIDHWSFVPAAVVAVIATVPIGLVFAVPALRVRGVTLALITFGLGAAVYSVVFSNTNDIGSVNGTPGTPVGSQSIFGWSIDASVHPARYTVLVLACLGGCMLVLSSVRRSSVGRNMVAVRANERAAAALGVNVAVTKLYAFGLAAAFAALGGVLLAFQFQTIDYNQFDSFTSILAVSYAVIGGIGFVSGAAWGALLAPGGIVAWALDNLGTTVSQYLTIIGGVGLLISLLQNPDGIQSQLARLARALRRGRHRVPARRAAVVVPSRPTAKVVPATLRISDLAVHFGGVRAVDGVSLSVAPGQVTALIGPNGAGKTTIIDAITGFVRPTRGVIELDGVDISAWSAHRRARSGIARSFQSLELFEGVTVRENLLTASMLPSVATYLSALGRPGDAQLSPAALAAIQEFDLDDDLDRTPSELSYGKRRLVAVARAIAREPSILLLDEPVAGLDDTEAEEFSNVILRLARGWGIGMLIVEHDMSFVMRTCDSITVVDFGECVATGAPADVAGDPRVIAAYLGEPTVATPVAVALPGRTATLLAPLTGDGVGA